MFIGQVTRQGFATAEPASLAAAASEFRAHRHLRLDRFIEPALYDDWRRRVAAAPFHPRAYPLEEWDGTPPSDLIAGDSLLLGAFQFALHDARLFRTVEAIAGCATVRSFEPVIYRMAVGHGDRWHDDLPAGLARLVTFTLNMSEAEYTGGALEFAEAGTFAPLCRVENQVPGGALLFALSPSLVHRVAPVQSGARTVFAGWFSGRAPTAWPGAARA